MEPISAQEYHELEEVLKLRSLALNKEEKDLQAQLERLTTERDLHVREARRVRDEDEVGGNVLQCLASFGAHFAPF